ncbi:helix-turn-helix domain-containing protein [Streptomyces sp. NPDC001941]|uniref:helix-turn-helix domain-containing protein n=1 Tax=Streptomyces sp. NPDC001941 TaxID=3154659 RepID=UPI00332894E1
MALKQPNAPVRAPRSIPPTAPRSGVAHVNFRHSRHYTVVGNHLAQHRELSLLAIGLAVHIQSLPEGSRIGIRFLAARFPESEHRIARALRELEEHGYLARTRERGAGGRVVTRTVSYNQPGQHDQAERPQRGRAAEPEPRPPVAPPAPRPVPQAPPAPAPPETTPAASLLSGLRAHDPRLLLGARDVERLAPGVEAWLERGVPPEAVRRTLTAALPDGLRSAAGLLAYRLTALEPPPLPAAPRAPDPLQTCDGCERAFRSRAPGRCATCREATAA